MDDADRVHGTDSGTERRVDDADRVRETDTATHRPVDSAYLIKRQKAQFGGMKIGSCFFGWLTAAGTAVILTAAVVAILGAIGMA